MMKQIFASTVDYRPILLDFRTTLFQHLTTIMAIFGFVVANVLLFLEPVPFNLFFVAIAFSAFTVFLRLKAENYPNTTRYSFVMVLYLTLFASMVLFPVVWVATLYFPVVLIGALLMSNTNLIGSALFFALVLVLHTTGHTDYPLTIMVFSIGLMVAVTSTIVSTFNMALQWYSSMHRHADKLLQETRERRSELVLTVKSLETAYNTQNRLKQQLIFARKQAEEARRMKERFASNISHELRTPLNIVLGFSEILYFKPEVYGDIIFPPKLHRDVAQIYQSSRHLLAMIDDVLDLSHIELSQFSLNFEPTSMSEFLLETGDMVRNLFNNKPEVKFCIDIAPHLPELEIDRTRLRQVMINLITNAHRFTDQGTVTLRALLDFPSLTIIVEDTGAGIEKDKLGLIFEEFYQVDYSLSRAHGGAGLGLAITKRFVEAHNGTISVSSKKGQGSRFTIQLPLPRHSPAYVSETEELISGAMLPPLILVFDPDPRVSELFDRLMNGFEVIAVYDEYEIVDYVRQYSPLAVIYNKLPDSPIPEHLNTLDVLTIVCSLPSAIWISQDLQVDSLMAKPFHMEQLVKQLQQFPLARNILIVDDDIGFVQLVQRSLEILPEDYVIQRAYDGKQALEMIESKPPDLMFIDLNMPELNGWELIKILNEHEHLSEIPITVLTATEYHDTYQSGDIHIFNNRNTSMISIIGTIKNVLMTAHTSV